MKKLGVIAAVLILLAGGTIAVMTWMGYDVLAMLLGGEQTSETGAPPAEEPAEPPRFVDVAPIVVPLLDGKRMVAAVSIEVKLQAVDAEAETLLRRLMPKISDAFLRDMYAYLPRILKADNEIDPEMLKDRLLLLVAKATGNPDLVTDLTVSARVDQT